MRYIHRLFVTALLLAGPFLVQGAAADDTWRGCLTGTKDNYVLRSVDGNLYRLHSSDDMKDHVGQMVEVKGHVKNKDRDKQALATNDVNQNAGVTIPTVGIDVEHIKALSMACPSAPVEPGAAAGAQTGISTEESSEYQHYTGCLTGTTDNFMLRADDGTLYRLHGDEHIREHVGDRVDVRGKINNSKREREAQINANSEAEAGVQLPKVAIDVDGVRTITKGCAVPPRQ